MASGCDGVEPGRKKKGGNTVLQVAQTNRAAGILATLLVLRCINSQKMKKYDKSGSGLLDGIGPTTKLKASMQLYALFILTNQAF